MANDCFWWRGRCRRTNGNGRAIKGRTPREYLKVPSDVHRKLVRVAQSEGVTVRAAMDLLFADLGGAR